MKARWVFGVFLVGSLACGAAKADIIQINVDQQGHLAEFDFTTNSGLNGGNVLTGQGANLNDTTGPVQASTVNLQGTGVGWPTATQPIPLNNPYFAGFGYGAGTNNSSGPLFTGATIGDVNISGAGVGDNSGPDIVRFDVDKTISGPNQSNMLFFTKDSPVNFANQSSGFGLPSANVTAGNTPGAVNPVSIPMNTNLSPPNQNLIASYTPTAGQPGFISGNVVTYNFYTDGNAPSINASAVPEPSPMVLAGLAGALGFAARTVRRRFKKVA